MRYEKDAVSNSMLNVLKRCPIEFRMRFIDKTWPEERSESLIVGSAVHCLSLQPSLFDEKYAVEPKADGRTKIGKVIKAEFAKASAGKEVLTDKEYNLSISITQALKDNEESRRILDELDASDAIVEKPFHGRIDDMLVAGTPDLVLLDRRVIYDIKTTQDASKDEFEWTITDRGYHRQAAMYRELLRQATGEEFSFVFVAVQNKLPHNVGVYKARNNIFRIGELELFELLEDYRKRKESNDWLPAYSKGVFEVDIPRRYRGQVLH